MSEKLTFPFDTALHYLKQGQRLTRSGKENEYIYLSEDTIYVKYGNKTIAWSVTHNDLLAEDWQFFGE